MLNQRLSFYYDPTRQGYDTTLWKTLGGTPAVSGSALRFNSASAISYADFFKEDSTLNISIPTAPDGSVTYNTLAGGSFAPGDTITDTTTAVVIGTVISDNGTTMVLDTVNGVLTPTDTIDNGTGVTAVIASSNLDIRSFGLKQVNANAYAVFDITGSIFSAQCSFNGVTTSVVIPWQAIWTATPTDFTIKWHGFDAEFIVGGVRQALISDLSVPKVALSTFISNSNADNMDVFYVEDQNVQGYI